MAPSPPPPPRFSPQRMSASRHSLHPDVVLLPPPPPLPPRPDITPLAQGIQSHGNALPVQRSQFQALIMPCARILPRPDACCTINLGSRGESPRPHDSHGLCHGLPPPWIDLKSKLACPSTCNGADQEHLYHSPSVVVSATIPFPATPPSLILWHATPILHSSIASSQLSPGRTLRIRQSTHPIFSSLGWPCKVYDHSTSRKL